MDGDLLVNRDGVRIVSQSQVETPPLIQPSDNQISLADFDAIKVIGKGNGGIVRLVQHKWTGQFFALKVIYNFHTKHALLVVRILQFMICIFRFSWFESFC
ncbi:hypothetical protein CsSME_00024764 [Camellia sinensis var. sinensis]